MEEWKTGAVRLMQGSYCSVSLLTCLTVRLQRSIRRPHDWDERCSSLWQYGRCSHCPRQTIVESSWRKEVRSRRTLPGLVPYQAKPRSDWLKHNLQIELQHSTRIWSDHGLILRSSSKSYGTARKGETLGNGPLSFPVAHMSLTRISC